MYLRNLSGWKSLRYSHQCRPKPAVHESDLSIYQTANEHVFRIGDGLQDCENLLALGMSPPAPFDRLVHDRLRQPRNGAFGGCENHAVFLDE